MVARRVHPTVWAGKAGARRCGVPVCLAGGVLAAVLGLLGSGCGDAFTGGKGAGGAGGTTTTSSATGGGGAGTGGTDAGGAQGGSAQCPHDECSIGEALSDSCSPCVLQVCTHDAPCCADTWRAACVLDAVLMCGKSCPDACTAAFGSTAGFVPCTQGPGTCVFITTANDSCVNVCLAQGMSCSEAALITGGCDGVVTSLACGDSSPERKLCTCSVQ